MKPLCIIFLLITSLGYAQGTPSPQTPNNETPESGIGKIAEDMVDQAENLVNFFNGLLLERQGNCIYGNCENSFGVSDLPDGGVFRGFYENKVGVGFSHRTWNDGKTEIFSNYDFSNANKTGFMLVLAEEDVPYQFMSFDTNEGIGFFPNSKKYGYFRLVDGKAKDAIGIDPNGEDLGCVGGNCYNGAGIYRYNNNNTYAGLFKDGKPHGIGEMWYSVGMTYWGEFVYGVKEGQGIEVYADNVYYFGDFKNNKRHGKGVYVTKEENYRAGQWVNNELVSSSLIVSSESGKTANQSSTSSNTNASATINPLSDLDQQKIRACKGEKQCLKTLFAATYEGFKSEGSEETALQKTANYLLGQDLIYPERTLNMVMSYTGVPPEVINYLPQNLRDRLKKEAQGIAVDYQKYINSEATKKAIEAKGGRLNKN